MGLARMLARQLADEAGALTLARMQTLACAARSAPPPEPADTRVGIWEPELEAEGAIGFRRSSRAAAEWRLWADVERIPPKRRRRVVLLGESAARGYLFDPAVTPAAILAERLPDREVVDLARTDITLPALAGLLDGLHALEPDEIVLFAGNNWHNAPFGVAAPPHLAAALRERGYAGLRRVFVEQIVRPGVEAFLERLAQTAGELGARVCAVVPEFNLADWRGEPELLCPALSDDGNARWMEARERASAALAAEDLEEAARAAQQMLDLDAGTAAAGQELLAEVALRRGRTAEARARLEAARDAVYGILVAHSPRCPDAVQRLLRRASARHGFAMVDLPRVFERALAGELPDRRLFLDYCHLTLEGMRVAMGEVARVLGGATGVQEAAPPPAGAEGIAHFLAAIHNAHYGQSDAVVRHHTERALAASPNDVARAMLGYAAALVEPGERWTSASFEAVWSHPAARRYLAPVTGALLKLEDSRLLAILVDALEQAGHPARERVAAAAARRRDPANVDLLAPEHRARAFRERGGYSLGPERAWMRAVVPRSRFHLERAAAGEARARLCCRLPGRAGEVVVRVGAAEVGRLEVGPRWATHSLALPLQAGPNSIALEWPPLAADPDALERAARSLERGSYPEVVPSFGEVYSFRVG